MTRTRWVALALALVGCMGSPWADSAAADVLVLQDGTNVETQGEWQVKGRLVVFKSAAGALSSMRLTEVDLDASREATESAHQKATAPPEEPKPQEKRKAVLVLTDKDLPKALPPAAEEEEESDSAADGSSVGEVAVSEWDISLPEDRDGALVSGRLRNNGPTIAVGVQLEVLGYDSDGTLIGRMAADVPRRPVAPGRVVDFEAVFRGIYNISAAKFVVKSETFSEQKLGAADSSE